MFKYVLSRPVGGFMKPMFAKKILFYTSLRMISIESTPNPSCFKFYPGKIVMGANETMDFSDPKFATISPLAQELFEIDGVVRVFYGNDFISVSKNDEFEWDDIQDQIKDNIKNYYENKKPLLNDEFAEGVDRQYASQEVLDDDSEAVGMIKEILMTRVRPFVQEDGGDVAFIDFDEESGIVTLLMKGS